MKIARIAPPVDTAQSAPWKGKPMNNQDKKKISKKIKQLSRSKIQSIFEEYGFAVYPQEKTSQLKRDLKANIFDGTISEEVLEIEYV